jgi:hypothetical protein
VGETRELCDVVAARLERRFLSDIPDWMTPLQVAEYILIMRQAPMVIRRAGRELEAWASELTNAPSR